jgi:hypothetical protein
MPERQITYTNATQLKLFPTTAYLFQLETTDFLDDFSSKLRHMRDVEKIGTLGYMGNWCSPDTLDLKEDWNFPTIYINPPYGSDRERKTTIKN